MTNTSIIVCGQSFNINTEVVLWTDPKGFNAYDTSSSSMVTAGKRYGYRNSKGDKLTLSELQDIVIQFFLHHSGLYRARDTFHTLHNERKLSVHFILDDNGVIYQTLDLRERAFHGSKCNNMSVGIEIDSRAFVNDNPNAYDEQHQKKYGVLPRLTYLDHVQDRDILGYEYNDKQYQALINLGIGLVNIFPKIAQGGDFPRHADDSVVKSVIDNPTTHKGFICHYNLNSGKSDPISFDHDRFLDGIVNNNPMSEPTIRNVNSIKEKHVVGDAFCPGDVDQCMPIDLNGWANIQLALKTLNYYDGKIDGIFGSETRQALKDFQNDHDLSVDGVWGPKTKAKMEAVLRGDSV